MDGGGNDYYDQSGGGAPGDDFREDNLTGRLNYKYDVQAEADVVGWLNALLSEHIPAGKQNVHKALRTGELLAKLINVIYQNTPTLPPGARQVPLPIRYHASNLPFKQMENIQMFLNCAEYYGVARTSLFQTVDLYEGQNMALVISCLLQLGTACQKNGFRGPVVGPRPTTSNARVFSNEQLRMGDTIIGLQAGTNKYATAAGIQFGGVRHVADIRCDDMNRGASAVINLQMGTNKFATQAGMNFGAQRHAGDIKCEGPSRDGGAVIGLQMGTNKFATQTGIVFGAQRHVSDLRPDLGNPGVNAGGGGYYRYPSSGSPIASEHSRTSSRDESPRVSTAFYRKSSGADSYSGGPTGWGGGGGSGQPDANDQSTSF